MHITLIFQIVLFIHCIPYPHEQRHSSSYSKLISVNVLKTLHDLCETLHLHIYYFLLIYSTYPSLLKPSCNSQTFFKIPFQFYIFFQQSPWIFLLQFRETLLKTTLCISFTPLSISLTSTPWNLVPVPPLHQNYSIMISYDFLDNISNECFWVLIFVNFCSIWSFPVHSFMTFSSSLVPWHCSSLFSNLLQCPFSDFFMGSAFMYSSLNTAVPQCSVLAVFSHSKFSLNDFIYIHPFSCSHRRWNHNSKQACPSLYVNNHMNNIIALKEKKTLFESESRGAQLNCRHIGGFCEKVRLSWPKSKLEGHVPSWEKIMPGGLR